MTALRPENRLPEAFLQDLIARTDLGALVGRDVALRKNGREFKGLCPFHSERSPSFTVVPSKGFYHCFGCGAHGDAIGWMMEARGMEFMPAVEALADLAGLDVPGRRRSGPVSQGRPLAPVVALVRDEDQARRDEDQRVRLYRTWCEAGPVMGSPVEVYLNGRGIRSETVARLQALRFAALPYYRPVSNGNFERLGVWPCMVAALTGPDGRFVGLHQTWLADGGRGKRLIVTPDGERLKAKKVRGRAAGAAIRLGPIAPGAAVMGGAEGIETAASVIQALGEEMAVWALYSLGNLAGGGMGLGAKHPAQPGKRLPSIAPDPERPGFVPPEGIQRFTWFADGDGKDPAAATAIIKRGAARYAQSGVTLAVARAPAGQDWNDVLTGGASHG